MSKPRLTPAEERAAMNENGPSRKSSSYPVIPNRNPLQHIGK